MSYFIKLINKIKKGVESSSVNNKNRRNDSRRQQNTQN